MESEPKFIAVVNRRHAPLFADLLVTGQLKEYFLSSIGLDVGLRNGKDINGVALMDVSEVAALRKIILEQSKEERFFQDFAGRCLFACERLLDTSTSISRLSPDIPAMPKAGLSRLFRIYVDRVMKIMPYLSTMIIVQGILEYLLREGLETALAPINKSHEVDDYLKRGTQASQDNLVVLEGRSILRIACSIQQSPELSRLFALPAELIASKLAESNESLYRLLTEHIETYGWLNLTYYLGRPPSVSDMVARIQQLIMDDCCHKLTEHSRKDAEMERLHLELTDTLNTSPELVNLFETTRYYGYLRTYKSDVLFMAHYRVRSLLSAIANMMGIAPDDLNNLDHREIEQFLQQGVKPDLGIMAERKNGFAVLLSDGEVRMVSGAAATAEQVTEPTQAALPVQLEGVTASLGKASGMVKILFSPDDLEKVERGDIVVTGMTTPNMIPALERCAAIITDEGGILCHAAVISRELGVPCIIDTKTATKVLRDWTRVDIDATKRKGIIKVII